MVAFTAEFLSAKIDLVADPTRRKNSEIKRIRQVAEKIERDIEYPSRSLAQLGILIAKIQNPCLAAAPAILKSTRITGDLILAKGWDIGKFWVEMKGNI